MQIVINDIPVSPNGPGGLLRMHWATRKRYNDMWKIMVRQQITPQNPPEGKMSVRITQNRRRRLDPDNLVASCKPILDALVAWGLIRDDSEKYCHLEVRQTTGIYAETSIEIENYTGGE